MRLMPLTIVLVVPVARSDLQKLGVVFARRFVADRHAITDQDGIVLVVTNDASIFDIHARRAIPGGRHAKKTFKANLERARLDLAVVVGLAGGRAVGQLLPSEPQMPLANRGRLIARRRKRVASVLRSVGMQSGETPLRIPAAGLRRHAY